QAILISTGKVLERNGFIVETAQTGQEAIEKSKTQHFDAALIDLRLPDMDGIEILSKADFGNTVKIMLTGFPSLVTGLAAMDRGVDAYLHKPVRPEELLLLVKSKLSERK
ncbi:MAG TPA: response regulator, partial [Candidatus Acidoferrales bacterium]|nr:response regulator [Candidatus Acidoferrales bacterium]